MAESDISQSDEARRPVLETTDPLGLSAPGDSDAHGPALGAEQQAPQVEGYEVIGPIGAGGMGVVWRAVQLSTRRPVALKLLGSHTFGSDRALRRFEREVELAARLEHPHVARVYDSGLYRGVYYYAMELVDGLPLDEYVQAYKLDRDGILRLISLVCRAVQHAHQHGVIHRDLKPSNILVSEDGHPHVLDFGLAKSAVEESDDLNVSMEGDLAGTPAFMSPEQAAGHVDKVDTRSDVYSLGVILYRLITGRPPHDLSGSHFTVVGRVAEQEVMRPRVASRALDRELEALLLKALARMADARYATAGDMARDIENYLSGEPLTAKPPTTVYFLRKRLRKHRVPIAVTCGVLLALGALAVFAFDRVQVERDKWKNEAYVNMIASARVALTEGNTELTAKLLEGCPKDLRNFEWHYVKRGLDRSVARFQHGGIQTLIAFTADGSNILGVSGKNTVSAWNATSGTVSSRQELDAGRLWALSPDGGLALGIESGDGKLVVWQTSDGRPVATLGGHVGRVRAAAVSRDGALVAVASADGAVRTWHLQAPAQPRTLDQLEHEATNLVLSPDGRFMAVAGNRGTVVVWELTGGKRVQSFAAHEKGLTALAFSFAGDLLVTASFDGTAKVWNVDSAALQWTMTDRAGPAAARIGCAAFSPDDATLFTGSSSGDVDLWNTRGREQGRRRATWHGDKMQITAVACDHASRRIVSVSQNSARIWDLTSSRDRIELPTSAAVGALAFSSDSDRLIACNAVGRAGVWDVQSWQRIDTFETDEREVFAVVFDAAGHRLATGGAGGVIHLRDGRTFEKLSQWHAHERGVRALAFGPRGTLASGGSSGIVKLWQGPDRGGPPTPELEITHGGIVSGVVFGPDGRWLVSSNRKGTIMRWDATTGALKATLADLKNVVNALALSRDGRMLAAAVDRKDQKKYIWAVDLFAARRGTVLGRLRGHGGAVRDLAFYAGGHRIASASDDGAVRLWNLASQIEVMRLHGGHGQLLCVCFSPDGRYLAAGAKDGTVLIWDAGPGAIIREGSGSTGRLRAAAAPGAIQEGT